MVKHELFNTYLRNKRIRLELSQTKLAKAAGVAVSTINRAEAGDLTRFPLDKVYRLAKALGEDREKFSALWIEAILLGQKEKMIRKIQGVGSE